MSLVLFTFPMLDTLNIWRVTCNVTLHFAKADYQLWKAVKNLHARAVTEGFKSSAKYLTASFSGQQNSGLYYPVSGMYTVLFEILRRNLSSSLTFRSLAVILRVLLLLSIILILSIAYSKSPSSTTTSANWKVRAASQSVNFTSI